VFVDNIYISKKVHTYIYIFPYCLLDTYCHIHKKCIYVNLHSSQVNFYMKKSVRGKKVIVGVCYIVFVLSEVYI